MKFEIELIETDYEDWRIIQDLKAECEHKFECLSEFGQNTYNESFIDIKLLFEDFENRWILTQQKFINARFLSVLRGKHEV